MGMRHRKGEVQIDLFHVIIVIYLVACKTNYYGITSNLIIALMSSSHSTFFWFLLLTVKLRTVWNRIFVMYRLGRWVIRMFEKLVKNG